MSVIIQLSKNDTDLIIRHMFALDDEALSLRFFSSVTPASIERYVRGIKWDSDTCFGVMYGDQLAGFIHLGKVSDDHYELGITVLEHLRGSGIASDLMQRAIVFCKARGVETLSMECLKENRAMQNLSKSLGLRVIFNEETAIAEACLVCSPLERMHEITKNMHLENISMFDTSMRAFFMRVRKVMLNPMTFLTVDKC